MDAIDVTQAADVTVGVLALQGAFAAHQELLAAIGVTTRQVRTPDDLTGVDALVMPGGESTTMSKLLLSSGLFDAIDERIAGGMPVFGTCAGMILLATDVLDGRPDQRSFGAIDIGVRRNGYGRQVDSFEADLVVPEVGPAPFHGVFIRAPKVERVGPGVDVVASHDGVPVLLRSGRVSVASFHPELAGDRRLHAQFVNTVLTSHRDATEKIQMSGHSKWASIKHKKGAADKARGKLFAKVARQIEVAAKSGGGDVDANPTLRTAVSKGRAARMTNDAIDRAIKRGTGEAGSATYEAITYEGYAPGGVALLIDVLTDNRNRTGAEIRSIFSKMGGSMAEPGAVGWQFSRRGVVMVDGTADEDALMLAALDAGADDVVDDGGMWRVMSEPSVTFDVKDALEAAGFEVESADTSMVTDNLVPVTSVEDAKKVLRIMEAIEDNDDVQDVYSNFDIADELMEAAAG